MISIIIISLNCKKKKKKTDKKSLIFPDILLKVPQEMTSNWEQQEVQGESGK